MLPAIVNYATHLIASAILLGVFFVIYTKVTPFDELALIHAGKGGAAWSLGGALVGFSLTLGSAIVHNATLVEVVMWAVAAMIVQIIVFTVASRLMHTVRTEIERAMSRWAASWARCRSSPGSSTPPACPDERRSSPTASSHARIRSFRRGPVDGAVASGA